MLPQQQFYMRDYSTIDKKHKAGRSLRELLAYATEES